MSLNPRSVVGRWIMRAREGGNVLQIAFWGATAVSTTASALYDAGLGEFVPGVVLGTVGAAVGFVYLYDSTGTLNEQFKHRMDRADNFAGPGIAINSLIRSAQLAAAVESLEAGDSPEERRERVERATREALREYREGIDVGDVYGGEP